MDYQIYIYLFRFFPLHFFTAFWTSYFLRLMNQQTMLAAFFLFFYFFELAQIFTPIYTVIVCSYNWQYFQKISGCTQVDWSILVQWFKCRPVLNRQCESQDWMNTVETTGGAFVYLIICLLFCVKCSSVTREQVYKILLLLILHIPGQFCHLCYLKLYNVFHTPGSCLLMKLSLNLNWPLQ